MYCYMFFTECIGYKVSVKKLFSISDLDCLVVGGLILLFFVAIEALAPSRWLIIIEKSQVKK